jgi:hypothetical protein
MFLEAISRSICSSFPPFLSQLEKATSVPRAEPGEIATETHHFDGLLHDLLVNEVHAAMKFPMILRLTNRWD